MPTETTMPPEAAEHFLLHVRKETTVNAPPSVVWDAMLAEIGPDLTKPDGSPMPLVLEPWPGGRYYRDLGSKTGHLWGHVQVIKPPTLLEIYGPLMMSHAAISHVQYRITPGEQGRASTLTLTHRAFGDIDPEHRKGVSMGWQHFIDRIRERAQR